MNDYRRIYIPNATSIDLTSSYDYDALDRIIKVTDSLGNEVINNFDANGQLWKVTHRYKKPDATYDVRDVVTKTYDAAERVKTETDVAGSVTSYTYDANGNAIAVTDAEGHIAQVEYDAMNRKTAVIDATGYRTETRYNQRGEVLSVTNANNETLKFEYDQLGRKTATIDPQGYRSEFQYDANNNLTCVIDANAKSLAADPGHQPLNADGCTESRSYDELNRLSQSKDAQNAVTIYSYDLQGHRLSVNDAENKTWSFAYDDLGRLQSETDHSGKLIGYKPDEAGNSYEKTNRLLETSRYSYDNANRLSRVDYLKDNSSETFGYDPAGNLNAAGNATVNYGFQYDNLNRLTGKTDDRARSISFTYDKIGNMLI
jgi:YD repeat-containing protein